MKASCVLVINGSGSPWLRFCLHPWVNVQLGTSLQGVGWSHWMLLLYGLEESRSESQQRILEQLYPEGSGCTGGWLLVVPQTWSTYWSQSHHSILVRANVFINNRGMSQIVTFIHRNSWQQEHRGHLLFKIQNIHIQFYIFECNKHVNHNITGTQKSHLRNRISWQTLLTNIIIIER